MKNTQRLLAFQVIAGLVLTGCASYRHNVSDDFRDTVKLNVGVGVGLYAQVKATSYLDAGIGWGGYWADAGLENRYTPFLHRGQVGCSFPLGVIPGAIPEESPITSLRMTNVRLWERSDMKEEYAVIGQLFDASAITKWDSYSSLKRSPHKILKNHEQSYTDHPLGFEASIGLLLINARVGFDPVEFVDLLCTICGWDMLKDNHPSE